MKKGLSIIMPCLNEENTLGVCISKALGFIENRKIEGEIIVADNGSTDNSAEIARKLGATVVYVKEKGYGAALRGGIDAAQFEYIIMGDADDSYDFSELNGFVDKLDEGFDLVMGNRFLGGIEPGAMSFSHKYIGNPILSGIGRLFYGSDISDFHCGLRGFRKDSIKKLELSTTGMEFASEMVVKATLFKLRVCEIPIRLFPDGRGRPPHLRSIPDGLRHLKFLLIYSPKWLFFYPGIFFSLLGIVLTLIIFLYPIQIQDMIFDIASMFYSSIMCLVGIQLIQFSLYTSIFGKRVGQFPKESKWMIKIENYMQNYGFITSLIIILIGIIFAIISVYRWYKVGFGILDGTDVHKLSILAGLFFFLGVQMFFSSFFIGVLHMGESG